MTAARASRWQELVVKMVSRIAAQRGNSDSEITDATKAARLGKLDDELFTLGLAEESALRWLREHDLSVERRSNADPLTIVGVKITRQRISLAA